MYSFYILITAPQPPSNPHKFLFLLYGPALGHQVEAGMCVSSPIEVQPGSSARGRGGFQWQAAQSEIALT